MFINNDTTYTISAGGPGEGIWTKVSDLNNVFPPTHTVPVVESKVGAISGLKDWYSHGIITAGMNLNIGDLRSIYNTEDNLMYTQYFNGTHWVNIK